MNKPRTAWKLAGLLLALLIVIGSTPTLAAPAPAQGCKWQAQQTVCYGSTPDLLAPARERQCALQGWQTTGSGSGTLPLSAGLQCAWQARQTTYYSDATHSDVVGQTGLDCGCNDISWGVTSAYHTTAFLCCSVFTC
jgi:hypothetical protein